MNQNHNTRDAAGSAIPADAKATLLAPDQGERFTIIGGGVRILAEGATTAGRCCIFEVPVAPGDGPPLHHHDREDESFFVVDGRFKFVIGDKSFIGGRGTFGLAPRGSIHSFRNVGSTTGVMIVTCTPAGLETAFRKMRLPEANESRPAPNMDQIVAILAEHGVTIHGPPLDAE